MPLNETSSFPCNPLFAVLAAALLASPLIGQAADARAQTSFEGREEVVVVEVPVNVLGRDGKPVRGLTAEDFQLLDNGRPVPIDGVEVIDLDVLRALPSLQGRDLPPVARRHFLFLFDFSFSSPTAVLKARRAARDFVLHGMHPTDLAAVATYSHEQGPRLILSFTPDRGQLAHAIDSLGVRRQDIAANDPLNLVITPPGTEANFENLMTAQGETRDITEAIAEAGTESAKILSRQFEKVEKSYARSRITSWSRSLTDLGRLLNSVEGRKHLVYFSEGFDSRLLMGRQPNLGDERQVIDNLDMARGGHWMVDTDDMFGNAGLQRELGRMLEQLRRSDVVIQAVDIGGLHTDLDTPAAGGRAPGTDALFYMANETGGHLFEDANDLGHQLSRVLESSSVTYLLSFRPEGLRHDGRYRRLEVRLRDPQRGTRVSHREGYYEPRPFPELHPVERNLLASEAIAAAAPVGQVPMEVLLAAFRAGDGRAYVPVILEIDGEQLMAGQRGDQLRVELYAYASAPDGEIRDFFTQQVGLDLGGSRGAFAGTGLKFYGHLELPPGEHLVRVLVRNAETGRSGVRAVPILVPAFDRSEPVLLPPFFPEVQGNWVLVRERGQEGQGSVIYPFVGEGDPYIPAARPSLEPGAPARLCLVAYNLGAGELAVEGRVLDAAGEDVAAAALDGVRRTVTGIEGLDGVVATFRPDELPVGDYFLQVAVVDPATGARHQSASPFAIRR
ncbi:MAG TPA: VWA domain-containing protein [Thermoanaerobaculia bacterium]|nr:VWA domain-containing protein [Thermoanaerobaculia bacterium]